MAANAIDLTTVGKLKKYLQIDSSLVSDDENLQGLITSVSAFFVEYCDRPFKQDTYTQELDGNGKNILMLKNYPITAVSSLKVNGQIVESHNSGSFVGYAFNNYAIRLANTYFPKGFKNIEISYTAGYATVPFDVEQACLEVCGVRYKERDHIGHASKTLGDETVSYIISALTPSAKEILQPYKRVATMSIF